VAPLPLSPSWLWLQRRLSAIDRDWNDSLERIKEKNRHSSVLLEMPEAALEKLCTLRRDAACEYVQRRQIEVCPAKGTLTRDQTWLHLLRQAREIYYEALGTKELARTHTEIPVREAIVLGEACGDLERADVDRSETSHLFRADRPCLKVLLFRAVVTQAKCLRDRREDGEWWFPSEPHATTTAGTGRSPVHSLRRHPGRKPQRLTGSYYLVEEYSLKLEQQLGDRRIKITKYKIARAIGISKDTMNLFERESTSLSSPTRERIQMELTSGPTQAVINFFLGPESGGE
jgi:hypothetical protein